MKKTIINDKNISFKATGLFMCILDVIENKGECTTTDIKKFRDIANNPKVEGISAMKTGIDELLNHGYLVRHEVNKHGRVSEYIYKLPNIQEEEIDDLDTIPHDFHKFQKLWEQSIGLLSASTGMWLLKVANKMPYEIFEEAIFEADARGSKTFKYVKGIIDNWLSVNIRDEESLNKARAERNSKFEDAQIERVKKAKNIYNPSNSISSNKRFNKIKKTSEIQASKDIIDFIRSKNYGQKGVNKYGEFERENSRIKEKVPSTSDRLAEIRRRGK